MATPRGKKRSAAARGQGSTGTRAGSNRSTSNRSTTTASSGSRTGSMQRSGARGGTTSRTSNTGKITTDHKQIRRWVEDRGGQPACVRGTGGGGDQGVLRIDFPGYSGQEALEHIPWNDWFDKFEGANLALLYQDRTAGGQKSNFNKLVDRSEMGGRGRGGGAPSSRSWNTGRHGRAS